MTRWLSWSVGCLLVSIVTLLSCGQDYNSNSGDATKGSDIGIDCTSAPAARLCAAYTAIQSNHCFECHVAWSAYKTDAAWTGSGLVTAGNASGSVLISRIRNAGGDMPQNYGPLPQADYDALLAWIGAL